ncbi:MAG: aminoacetone oxidase family FAD-binding enzyme, partial [Lachnospiraceae bacterium]|nr:aminoacetone oxidase family FAD-binding enzyme [Lachnospiraceae bacterium]
MKSIEVMVIGGGASGMMAAVTAAEAGAKVILVEKLARLGKKLLATGNGRCNFTNTVQKEEYYHSRTDGFVWQVISAFDEQQVMAWFQRRGVLPMVREGYVYPRSAQAVSVVQIMQRMLAETGVQIHTEESLCDVVPHQGRNGEIQGYEVVTSSGKYLAGKVILASGGAAAPVHGTSGDGYEWVKRLGIPLVPPVPALTSLVLEGRYCKIWSGVRIDGQVSLYSDSGQCLGSDRGEIQMVSYGISGIPVFQISHLAARELE